MGGGGGAVRGCGGLGGWGWPEQAPALGPPGAYISHHPTHNYTHNTTSARGTTHQPWGVYIREPSMSYLPAELGIVTSKS